MTEGGFPDGMCVHGATGSQNQLPKDVPKISSSAVAMKMAANSGQRGDRTTNHANHGSHRAPIKSTPPATTRSPRTPPTPPMPPPSVATPHTPAPNRLTTG